MSSIITRKNNHISSDQMSFNQTSFLNNYQNWKIGIQIDLTGPQGSFHFELIDNFDQRYVADLCLID